MGVRTQALRDLLGRYGAVLGLAWARRKDLDPPPRLLHEAQFLPAALALQETPVHPAPRVAMRFILTFAVITLAWAIVGKVDVVATATGKIIPNDRTKIIQPMETAVVKAIHVADGQSVKAGDLLVELDATIAQADTERLRSDLQIARFEAARAKAMLDAMDNTRKRPVLDASFHDIDAKRLAAEQRLLEGEYNEHQSRLSQLDAEIEKREAEHRATVEAVEKLKQTVPIAKQRTEDYRNLMEKNHVSRHAFLEREQERIEKEGDLATQQATLTEIDASILEARRQKTALVAETRRIMLDRNHEAEQKAVTLSQELVKAEQRGRLMRLTAPVDGTVQQLAVHTIGGVVTAAQPLLVIVPRDNQLEAEAFVANKDIGFVYPGDEARVKIETFPFTKYGTIPGNVQTVSSDAIQDENLGLVYAARVKLARNTMRVENKTVNLTPGMAVTVEIKTGRRRLIEYFLSPLLKYKDESLRER